MTITLRVGTHALKDGSVAKLWDRLRTHRGSASSGGGNHRGSVFRLILGEALINKRNYNYENWGKGSTAPKEVRESESPLEKEVSILVGDMSLLWVAIEDEPGPESDRGRIERNSIALLSNYQKPTLDPPSLEWLGRYSDRPLIEGSGLWNSNHVAEKYDPEFLNVLETMVEIMEFAS